MFCFHKYGEIKNGYQYCTKCGKVIVVPVIPCNHKWEYVTTINTAFYSSVMINKCVHCGIIKQYKIM